MTHEIRTRTELFQLFRGPQPGALNMKELINSVALRLGMETIETKGDLEESEITAATNAILLLGLDSGGDGESAIYKRVASEPGHADKIQSLDGTWWEKVEDIGYTLATQAEAEAGTDADAVMTPLRSRQHGDARYAIPVLTDLTFQVPTDYATLQAAIDELSHRPYKQGTTITVNVETGHALTAGLTLENGDYSHFTITSTDAEVLLDAGWTAGDYVAKFTNCRAPNWGLLVNCEQKDTGDRAFTVQKGSYLQFVDGSGIKNTGGAGLATGLFVLNAEVDANECTFTGCGGTNVHGTLNSRVNLNKCDLSGGEVLNGQGHGNVFISRGTLFYGVGSNMSDAVNGAGLKSRRSICVCVPLGGTNTKFNNNAAYAIKAEEGSRIFCSDRTPDFVEFDNCPNHAIEAVQSSLVVANGGSFATVTFDAVRAESSARVVVYGATMTGIGRNAVFCDSAFVNADDITADDVGATALWAQFGGHISAANASCTGALGAQAVMSTAGSLVNCHGIDVSGAANRGLDARNGGKIVAPSSTGTGCGTFGMIADNGAEIIAPTSDYSGGSGIGAQASGGSRISIVDTNVQLGGVTSVEDCKISEGSIIHFAGGTGGVNTTVNTLTSAGIIFQ